MNDSEFLAALEDGSLPKPEFTHRNHLRAGWLYLERHPLPEAAMACALAIQKYAAGLGLPEKFHLTLTLAFMHILAERRERHPARDWETFLAACPDLQQDAKALIAQYYSEPVLDSERARKTFVPPDRQPLPLTA
ncbi:MAG TPA: hypothetical protein VF254_06115 [Gammaproteobacteria bacterium]|jgi:hypothetical protein